MDILIRLQHAMATLFLYIKSKKSTIIRTVFNPDLIRLSKYEKGSSIQPFIWCDLVPFLMSECSEYICVMSYRAK